MQTTWLSAISKNKLIDDHLKQPAAGVVGPGCEVTAGWMRQQWVTGTMCSTDTLGLLLLLMRANSVVMVEICRVTAEQPFNISHKVVWSHGERTDRYTGQPVSCTQTRKVKVTQVSKHSKFFLQTTILLQSTKSMSSR